MNTHLQHHFDLLETERAELLNRVAHLSPEKFNRSTPGKWSPSQILAHLLAAERLSVRYMNKKILGIQNSHNTGIAEELKMGLLKLSQRIPFKFKAPKAVIENTPTYANLEELKIEWERERGELKRLLEKFDDDQIRKKVYRHVRAGMLNIQQALIFFREHIHHHIPQLKRLL